MIVLRSNFGGKVKPLLIVRTVKTHLISSLLVYKSLKGINQLGNPSIRFVLSKGCNVKGLPESFLVRHNLDDLSHLIVSSSPLSEHLFSTSKQ